MGEVTSKGDVSARGIARVGGKKKRRRKVIRSFSTGT